MACAPTRFAPFDPSQYENGQRQIPIEQLIALAKYDQTSTDYVLGLTEEQKPYP